VFYQNEILRTSFYTRQQPDRQGDPHGFQGTISHDLTTASMYGAAGWDVQGSIFHRLTHLVA
jgi:hypothetical protein